MMPKPRPFQTTQLRTRFRDWELIATNHPTLKNRATVTGKKGAQSFHINRLQDFEEALRAGKAEVDRREGVQEWNESYTNEALR